MRKIALAKRAEDATEASWKDLEPADADVAVFEPVNFFWVVLGSINRGGWKKVRDRLQDAFGAANVSEPVANKGNFHYFAPSRRKTTLIVRRRIWKSRASDQFLI